MLIMVAMFMDCDYTPLFSILHFYSGVGTTLGLELLQQLINANASTS